MSHIYTDTIPRNPDVALHLGEQIPPGYYVHEGDRLMNTARAAKVPFGVCQSRVYYRVGKGSSRIKTIGLIIRESDRERFNQALAKKKGNQ